MAPVILNTQKIEPGPMPTPDPFLFCVYHKDNYPPAGPNNKSMEVPHQQAWGNGHDFDPNASYRMYHGIKIPGFPQHPHRGFETITATIDGIIDHADSIGNAGRYGQGDVQWMTAGKGVVHSEMFPLIHMEKENKTKFFQIWLNLPKKSKMVTPSFAMFWGETIRKIKSQDGKVIVTNWFGGDSYNYFLNNDEDNNAKQEEKEEEERNIQKQNNNVNNECNEKNNIIPTENKPPSNSWANDPNNDVAIIHFHLKPGGKITLPKAKHSSKYKINRSLYIVELPPSVSNATRTSGLQIDNETFHEKMIIELDSSREVEINLLPSYDTDGADVDNNSNKIQRFCEILLLQGKPINESIAQHGPFVMNTWGEISNAFDDYYKTKFGGWSWDKDEMVFPQEKGRFALVNGEEILPKKLDYSDDYSCNDYPSKKDGD